MKFYIHLILHLTFITRRYKDEKEEGEKGTRESRGEEGKRRKVRDARGETRNQSPPVPPSSHFLKKNTNRKLIIKVKTLA